MGISWYKRLKNDIFILLAPGDFFNVYFLVFICTMTNPWSSKLLKIEKEVFLIIRETKFRRKSLCDGGNNAKP